MLFDIKFVHWLAILSVLTAVGGASIYIRDTYRGTTKPNRVTWSLWAFAPLIATVAALSAGADVWPTIRVFVAGFIPVIVLAVSFYNPKSYWKLGPFDFGSGTLAVIALIFWVLADSPRSAVLFLALADGFAALPTIVKSWNHPETETGLKYITALASSLLILPAIPVWNIENAAFQIFLVIQNMILVFAIYGRRLSS